MAASITKAGESLIAKKQAAGEVLEVVRFVLALVPDLDTDGPVDREALKPPAEQIVHTQAYTQKGFINPNQVVYSLMMGSDIGDFNWNWIGLETAEEVLHSVAYVPVQQKRKNIPPLQIGNNVTRNFIVEFDGAQALTAITVDASTWQHDFTVRLTGIDERERLSNRDIYGRACFFDNALLFSSYPGKWGLKPGIAYIEGIRVELSEPLLMLPAFPANTIIWLDVCLERQANNRVASWKAVHSANSEPADYTDSAGQQHYCVPICSYSSQSDRKDLRTREPIKQELIKHLAAREGNYAKLRARATTKTDIGLGNLPNAKSDDPTTNNSEILATTAALNNLNQQISDSMVGMVASFDMATAPPGWLKRNGADVSRTAYGKLFAVIGTRYGAGDGSTTFNVGDSRGVFIRGLDEGRGLDPDRVLGSLQQGQNLAHDHAASAEEAGAHTHEAWTGNAGNHAHNGNTTTNGEHQHIFGIGPDNTFNGAAGVGNTRVSLLATDPAGAHSHGITTDTRGDHTHGVGIGAAADHAHTITVAASGGTEVRPINQALLICIKY